MEIEQHSTFTFKLTFGEAIKLIDEIEDVEDLNMDRLPRWNLPDGLSDLLALLKVATGKDEE